MREAGLKCRLLEKYASATAQDRELVARVVDRFGRNAQAIEQTDGLRGLLLLDRLDIEAIFLYEKRPSEFRRLRDLLGTEAAADVLLHWREYFGLKRADDTDRSTLIAEIARLTPVPAEGRCALPRHAAADPGRPARREQPGRSHEGRSSRHSTDALAVLCFMSLEHGPGDLQRALQTLELHERLALDAFRKQGPDGFALVSLYGPILEALGDAVPLDQALIVIRVNAPYIDRIAAVAPERDGRRPHSPRGGRRADRVGRRQPERAAADRRIRAERRDRA